MSPQQKVKELLYYVQVLHWNDEISNEQKNQLVRLISQGRRTGDFSEVGKVMTNLSFGVIATDVLEEAIQICNS